jgi:Protein of unknown function (DUF2971)
MGIDENKYRDILNKYVRACIKPYFGIASTGSSYLTHGDSGKFSGSIILPTYFSDYKETDYHVEGRNKKFIHFTSLDNFFHIINNGYFKAASMSSLDDPGELIYAGKELSGLIEREQLELIKDYLFSFSMCYFEEEKSDSFAMWNAYGDKGRGVGIVFSFYDNLSRWRDIFLSNVHYENEKIEKFGLFRSAHENFIQNNPEMMIMRDFLHNESGPPDSLSHFLAFHKSRIFKDETEVRFLKSYVNEYWSRTPENNDLGIKFDTKKGIQYFFKILLLNKVNICKDSNKRLTEEISDFKETVENKKVITLEQSQHILHESPIVKIEKVILGYRFKEDNKLSKNVNDIARKIDAENFQFEIQLSKLASEFYCN